MTGDVFVYEGTLLIGEDFNTTGELTLEFQGAAQIVVLQGKLAWFN